MPSSYLILCPPLLLLLPIPPSIRVFSNESALLMRWPKYWSFSISPSREYSGMISFRINWYDILTGQRTLKSFLQYHSSKALILWCSAFFKIHLSHLYSYMNTRKTIAFSIQAYVSKMMSLIFNTLSKLQLLFFLKYK